jgi:glutathione S-transferase
MTELVFYDAAGVPSPRRVKIYLLEKGLPFKIRWLNLGLMDQKEPSYLKLNPMGLVPTLVHNGKAIFESNVINEYIDALFPTPPLAPKNAYGQAQMRCGSRSRTISESRSATSPTKPSARSGSRMPASLSKNA